MELVSAVLAPFLEHPISQKITKTILFSPYYPFYIAVQSFWISSFVAISVQGIYITITHQIVLALLMSLVNEYMFLFLDNSKYMDVPFWSQLSAYNYVTIRLFLLTIVLLMTHYYLPEKITYNLLKILKIPIALAGSVTNVRIFARVSIQVPIQDINLLLVLCLFLMEWPIFIDYVARTLTGKRSVNQFSKFKTVFNVCLAGAIVFSMGRKSMISGITGIYPIDLVTFFLLISHSIIYIISSF